MGTLLVTPMGGAKTFELDTISCPHCQTVRAITLRGCTKNVQFNHWCSRCHAHICQGCAAAMQRLGECPGPYIAKVDESVSKQRPLDDTFAYKYRSTSRA